MLDAFAGRMLAALYDARDDGGSFVASPASAYVALEMLARGTEGETFDEIDTALGGGAARKAAHEALFGESDSYQPDGYCFTLGVSVWADPSEAPLRRSYVKSLKGLNAEVFAGKLQSGEVQSKMADWLACNTGGKFATAPVFGPDASLALLSALHFKDTWFDRFEEEIELEFNALAAPQTVPAMVGWGDCGWLIDDVDGAAVRWPMMSGASVVFAMPRDAGGIGGFVSSGVAWRLITRCRDRQSAERPAGGIDLTVPVIDLEADGASLVELLKGMGVHRAFSPAAQLTGMTKANAKVDSVVQNAQLKLDLNGAEGAAFTLVVAAAAGVPGEWPPEPVEVVFDRPFAFALFSSAGAPLFVGVYEGTASEDVPYGRRLTSALSESRKDFEEGRYYSSREDLLAAAVQKR